MAKWDNDMLAYIQAFRSAIGFYADPKNYVSEDATAKSAVMQDCGERANKIVEDFKLLETEIKKRIP